MSINKYDTNKSFPFAEVCLANPTGLQGGAYFSKLKIDDKKILVQMPKCETKNGIHRTGKKIYTDLMFDNDEDIFKEWVNDLSERVKNLIYEKRDIWFQNEMSYDDIEYHWQNILRPYKKKKILLRCIIKKPKNINREELVMVYDEDENIVSLNEIKSETQLIPLLEITGLKFTTQSFLLEFALKQVMVLTETIDGNECLISINKAPKMTPQVSEKVPSDIGEGAETHLGSSSELCVDISANKMEPVLSDNKEEILKDEKMKENISTQEKETNKDIVQSNNTLEPLAENSKETLEKNTLNRDINEIKLENLNTLEKKEINEVNLVYPGDTQMLHLKKPDEVYLSIYTEAKRRAKEAKKEAIQAYLEVKRIKDKYMLNEIESSDDEFEIEAYE